MGRYIGLYYISILLAALAMCVAFALVTKPVETTCFLKEQVPGYESFIDSFGEILLDSSNYAFTKMMNLFPGVDIRHETQSEWRQRMGIADQPHVDLCASIEANQWVFEVQGE